MSTVFDPSDNNNIVERGPEGSEIAIYLAGIVGKTRGNMDSNAIYNRYCGWCRSLGIQPASRATYENEKRVINDAPAGFSRYGQDLLLHAGRRLRRGYVLKIAAALGIADEAAMLRTLGLIDAQGNVTAEGETLSRVRIIDGTQYRLWALDRVAALLGKAIEQQEAEEPQADALVVDILRSTAGMQLESAAWPN